MGTAAVIFDLDGVLIDSERVWAEVREGITREAGGHWPDEAQHAMMGVSSLESSSYMHDELGVPVEPAEISRWAVERVAERYREQLPLIPGAVPAGLHAAERWPLALASSANRPLIELALELSGLAARFQAIVSSEEVARGKPAPDVYLEAARRVGVDPVRAAAVEDSSNGRACGRHVRDRRAESRLSARSRRARGRSCGDRLDRGLDSRNDRPGR